VDVFFDIGLQAFHAGRDAVADLAGEVVNKFGI
jgi:hypothetical protein